MSLSETEVKNRINKANTNMIMIEDYKGEVRKYHKFKCLSCERVWERRLDHVFDGRGCRFCKGAIRYTTDEVNIIASKYHFKLMEEYISNQYKHKWKCLKCGEETTCQFMVINRGDKFCKNCSPPHYKNEKLTLTYLKEILPNIEVIKNFKIDEVIKYKNKIIKNFCIVDFYFEIDSKKFFVEYNGSQHYYPCTFWEKSISESKDKFHKQVIRDEWLRNYCILKDIKLIEIDGRYIRNIKIKEYLVNILSNHHTTETLSTLEACSLQRK